MNPQHWANFFSKKEEPKNSEEFKANVPKESIKEKVRQLTQNLVKQQDVGSLRNTEMLNHFRSSEKPLLGQNSMASERRLHSEKPKDIRNSVRQFSDKQEALKGQNNTLFGPQNLKSAIMRDRPSKKTVSFSDPENSKHSDINEKTTSFETRVERPGLTKELVKKMNQKNGSKNKLNIMEEDQEARRFKYMNQTMDMELNRLAGGEVGPQRGSHRNIRIIEDDRVLKVAINDRKTEPTRPVMKASYPSERVDFSVRGSGNKPKLVLSRKDKKIQEELNNHQIIIQNAMDRLHETGCIRQSHGIINKGDVINRIMAERTAFNRIVSCLILELLDVKGMTVAKIDIVSVGSAYIKDHDLKPQLKMKALFRYGTDIETLKRIMPNLILEVLNPETVICPKAHTKYLLINYYRIKK
jgi:hypothetical protein